MGEGKGQLLINAFYKSSEKIDNGKKHNTHYVTPTINSVIVPKNVCLVLQCSNVSKSYH